MRYAPYGAGSVRIATLKFTLQLHKKSSKRQLGVLENLYTCLPAGRAEPLSPDEF
jgi:hypothetical protein